MEGPAVSFPRQKALVRRKAKQQVAQKLIWTSVAESSPGPESSVSAALLESSPGQWREYCGYVFEVIFAPLQCEP